MTPTIAMPYKVTKILFHNIAFVIHKVRLIVQQVNCEEIIRGGGKDEDKRIQCEKTIEKTLLKMCFLLNANFYYL